MTMTATCQSCHADPQAKPLCKMCLRPMKSWPDNPAAYLEARGYKRVDPDLYGVNAWIDSPPEYRLAKVGMRTEQVREKFTGNVTNEEVAPVYQEQGRPPFIWQQDEAIRVELMKSLGPRPTIYRERHIFSPEQLAKMEERLKEQRGGANMLLQSDKTFLADRRERRYRVGADACCGCGMYPDGIEAEKEHK